MNEADLRECYGVINDFWKLIKRNCGPKDENYWGTLMREVAEIREAHNDSEFAQNMAYAVMAEMMRVGQKSRAGNASA